MANYNASTVPLFKLTNILPITDLHKAELLKLMYDIVSYNAPEHILETFTFNTSVHDHNTRQSKYFHIAQRTTSKASMSVQHLGPKLWLELPEILRKVSSKKLFKTRIKSHYLMSYN